MKDALSPAAQAVLTAFGTHPIRADHIAEDLVPALAAALRAAADQAPAPHPHEKDAFHIGFWAAIEYVRSIAVELEGA